MCSLTDIVYLYFSYQPPLSNVQKPRIDGRLSILESSVSDAVQHNQHLERFGMKCNAADLDAI